jgi:hypothetical protein
MLMSLQSGYVSVDLVGSPPGVDRSKALTKPGYPALMGWTVTSTIRSVAAGVNGGGHGIESGPEDLRCPPRRSPVLIMDPLEVVVRRFRTDLRPALS